MASRRVRIKGVLNIPQRKKSSNSDKVEVNGEGKTANEEAPQTNEHNLPAETSDAGTEQSVSKPIEAVLDNHKNDEVKSEQPAAKFPLRRRPIKPSISRNILSRKPAQPEEQEQTKTDVEAPAEEFVKPTNVLGENNNVSRAKNENDSNVPANIKLEVQEQTKTDVEAPAEEFVKPTNVLGENNNVSRAKNENDSNVPANIKLEVLSDIRIAPHIDNATCKGGDDVIGIHIGTKSKDSFFLMPEKVGERKGLVEEREGEAGKKANEVNINLNETEITSVNACGNKEYMNQTICTTATGITKLPKLHYIDGTKSNSDTEYPPQALSPAKFVNRSRIKAVPRLGHRRTSFSIGSASESEDDTKRTYSRNRNDSVCSIVSASNETPTAIENASPQKKEFSSVIQRKCKRTEQSRKLAEARRDFQMRFKNGQPDKQKLTMLDLIFYTPATAPMSQRKRSNTERKSECSTGKPDDPAPEENQPNADADQTGSDEENNVPAPQITIGANGEIVIDEKSLVIENKQTIKNREALKQSEIVDGDFDTNYGVYKRVKRSKDWSKRETLRFYKALNTIGTDFTLMCEVFPGRTRRELKMKFKKEERMNKALIDRALTKPLAFNMEDLQKELERDEMAKVEAERLKLEQIKSNKILKEEKAKGKKRKQSWMGGYIQTLDSKEESPQQNKKKKIVKTITRQQAVKLGINSIVDSDSDHSVSTTRSSRKSPGRNSSSESESETYNKVQITRSGRVSKPKSVEVTTVAMETDENVQDELTPGSIMIVTGENDKVCNIYTIDENRKKHPVELTPDLLADLTKYTNENLETTDQPEENDNNVTAVLEADVTIDNIIDISDISCLANFNNSELISDSLIVEIANELPAQT